MQSSRIVAIRQLSGNDAAQWIDLLKASVGEDYPDRQVYQADWVCSPAFLSCSRVLK
jgi:hypothetical protein